MVGSSRGVNRRFANVSPERRRNLLELFCGDPRVDHRLPGGLATWRLVRVDNPKRERIGG